MMETLSSTLVSRNEIPIIDLSDKGSEITPSKIWIQEKSKQLKHAFDKCGMVFFINHGIAEENMQAAYNIMDTFSALPDDVKQPYLLGPANYWQGYFPPGLETSEYSDILEFKHCYNINNLAGKLPKEEIPNFVEIIGGITEDFLNLSHLILILIAHALEIDPELFLSFFKGKLDGSNLSTLRVAYYPPLGEEPGNNIIRCDEHSDFSAFTLLTEDTEGGLEVYNGKEWNPVGHLPGGILFILADLMELWSSPQYKAIIHRVVVPKDVTVRRKSRHILGFFMFPENNTAADPSFFKYLRTKKEEDKPKEHVLTIFEYSMEKRVATLAKS